MIVLLEMRRNKSNKPLPSLRGEEVFDLLIIKKGSEFEPFFIPLININL